MRVSIRRYLSRDRPASYAHAAARGLRGEGPFSSPWEREIRSRHLAHREAQLHIESSALPRAGYAHAGRYVLLLVHPTPYYLMASRLTDQSKNYFFPRPTPFALDGPVDFRLTCILNFWYSVNFVYVIILPQRNPLSHHSTCSCYRIRCGQKRKKVNIKKELFFYFFYPVRIDNKNNKQQQKSIFRHRHLFIPLIFGSRFDS
jgi:hypothetical protein